MARRPIFLPEKGRIGVEIRDIAFVWHSGYSAVQKKKSIESLHDNANSNGNISILEVSTKSDSEYGIRLSAFNLATKTKRDGIGFTVETAFQSSKVFEFGGPFKELLFAKSIEAKKDERLKTSGKLIKFVFFGKVFPINPPTFFYDWLYINTLLKNNDLIQYALEYNAYSDIEFNPAKSINCQAYSLALFSSIILNGIEIDKLRSPDVFLDLAENEYSKRWTNNEATITDLDFS